jgi:pyruvate/2-oxoglutarate dehydrogenase complex dihydrolipoamide acyltransferase (E2) component
MPSELRIPKIGMSSPELSLNEWMVEDGEQVAVGDVICTVETDKTTVEIEAQEAGTIRVLAAEGESYPVGHLIGRIE